MARCGKCDKLYGLLELDREATFQSCPHCGATVSEQSESDDPWDSIVDDTGNPVDPVKFYED
ncbi:MAG: hypothetical protein ACXAE3_17655 [Candidatus Kariarchaeaceae archaeon]|jgi:hypothetical protein